MDSQFLEFWGNALIQAARSQRQMKEGNVYQQSMNDAFKWMKQGFDGFEQMSEMFRKAYGLEYKDETDPDYMKSWKTAMSAFQDSYRQFMDLMGMVPRDEHMELVEKYEALKEKSAEQEETIRHLRMLLSDKGVDQRRVVEEFQDLVRKQSHQFQELMSNVVAFYGENENADNKKKK